MGQFVKVGTTGEFENLQAGKLVEAGGRRIAVFQLGGSYYAIEDTCPHRGGSLSQGMVQEGVVVCPWHGAKFDVRTGGVLGPPAQEDVQSFPVRVSGTDVEVEV